MTYSPARSHRPHFLQIPASFALCHSRVRAIARASSSYPASVMTSAGCARLSERRSAPKPFFLHQSAPLRFRFSASLSHNRTSAAENSGISTIPVEVLRPLIGGNFRRNCRDFDVTMSRRVSAWLHARVGFRENLSHIVPGVRAPGIGRRILALPTEGTPRRRPAYLGARA